MRARSSLIVAGIAGWADCRVAALLVMTEEGWWYAAEGVNLQLGNLFLDNAGCVLYMFQTDMETHTPTPAERFAITKAELRARFAARGPRRGIARVVDLMILALFMVVIDQFARLAERRARRRESAGAEPGRVDVAGGLCRRSPARRGCAGCRASRCCRGCGCRGGR